MKKFKGLLLSLLVFVMVMSVATSFIGCGKKDADKEKGGTTVEQPDKGGDTDPTVVKLSVDQVKNLITGAAEDLHFIDADHRQRNELYFLKTGANKTFGADFHFVLNYKIQGSYDTRYGIGATSYMDTTRSNLQLEQEMSMDFNNNEESMKYSAKMAAFLTQSGKTATIDLSERTISFEPIRTESDFLQEAALYYGDRVLMGMARLLNDNTSLLTNSGVVINGTQFDGVSTITIDFKNLLTTLTRLGADDELSEVVFEFYQNYGQEQGEAMLNFIASKQFNSIVEITLKDGKYTSINLRQTYTGTNGDSIQINVGGSVASKTLTYIDNNYGNFRILSSYVSEDEVNYLQTNFTEDNQPVLEDGLYYMFTTEENRENYVYPFYIQNGVPLLPTGTHSSNFSNSISIVKYLSEDYDYNNVLGVNGEGLYLIKALRETVNGLDGSIDLTNINTFGEIYTDTVYVLIQKAPVKAQSEIQDGLFILNNSGSSITIIQGNRNNPTNLAFESIPAPEFIQVYTVDGEKRVRITMGETAEFFVENYLGTTALFLNENGEKKDLVGYLVNTGENDYEFILLSSLYENEGYKITSIAELLDSIRNGTTEITEDIENQIISLKDTQVLSLILMNHFNNAYQNAELPNENLEKYMLNVLLTEDVTKDIFSDAIREIMLQQKYEQLVDIQQIIFTITSQEILDVFDILGYSIDMYKQMGMEVFRNLDSSVKDEISTQLFAVDFDANTEPGSFEQLTNEQKEEYIASSPKVILMLLNDENPDNYEFIDQFKSAYGSILFSRLPEGEKEINIENADDFLKAMALQNIMTNYTINRQIIRNRESIQDSVLKAAVDSFLQTEASSLKNEKLILLDINRQFRMYENSKVTYKKLIAFTDFTNEIDTGLYKLTNSRDNVIDEQTIKEFILMKDAQTLIVMLVDSTILTFDKTTDTFSTQSDVYKFEGLLDNNLVILKTNKLTNESVVIRYMQMSTLSGNAKLSNSTNNIGMGASGLYKFTLTSQYSGSNSSTNAFYFSKNGANFSTYMSELIVSYDAVTNSFVLHYDDETIVISMFATSTELGKTYYHGYVQETAGSTSLYQNIKGNIVLVEYVETPSVELEDYLSEELVVASYLNELPLIVTLKLDGDKVMFEGFLAEKSDFGGYYTVYLYDNQIKSVIVGFLLPVIENNKLVAVRFVNSLNESLMNAYMVTIKGGESMTPGMYNVLTSERGSAKLIYANDGSVYIMNDDFRYVNGKIVISTIEYTFVGSAKVYGNNFYIFVSESKEYIGVIDGFNADETSVFDSSFINRTLEASDGSSKQIQIKKDANSENYLLKLQNPNVAQTYILKLAGDYVVIVDADGNYYGYAVIITESSGEKSFRLIEFSYEDEGKTEYIYNVVFS